jgi:hypothetical protein
MTYLQFRPPWLIFPDRILPSPVSHCWVGACPRALRLAVQVGQGAGPARAADAARQDDVREEGGEAPQVFFPDVFSLFVFFACLLPTPIQRSHTAFCNAPLPKLHS